jgi:hypothetical protein
VARSGPGSALDYPTGLEALFFAKRCPPSAAVRSMVGPSSRDIRRTAANWQRSAGQDKENCNAHAIGEKMTQFAGVDITKAMTLPIPTYVTALGGGAGWGPPLTLKPDLSLRMAAKREQWTEGWRCKHCARAGIAHLSELRGYSDYGTTVDTVPEGFAVVEMKDRRGRMGFGFSCMRCGDAGVRA